MVNFSQWIGAGVSAGLRPRLACELRPEGVVAARAEDGASIPSEVAYADLPPGSLVPGLHAGNLVDRAVVISSLRSALERVTDKTRQTTLIVPDAAARVLLLDFDTLPGKISEALPIVRFRLKKMLPFESDVAAVSYQVMSSSRGLVKVLAVAMPREVIDEYESAVREAGYEPGALLPSTLAALAAIDESLSLDRSTNNRSNGDRGAALVVNASNHAVTTAIVREGIVLLHRSIDLGLDARVEEEAEAVLEAAAEAEDAFGEFAVSTAAIEDEAVKAVVFSEAAIAFEVAQAVSVATAYYEDTLNSPLDSLLATGPFGAEGLQMMVNSELGAGFDARAAAGGVRVRELLTVDQLMPGAVSASIPRGLLAGVVGALRV